MAAKKRGRRTKQELPAEEPGLELEERELEEEPAAPELDDDVLGELDDESRFVVSIFRRVESGPRTGKPEYVARLSPAEFSLDNVRERFGGGTYEFRVLRKDDRGRERYHRTRTVHVAGAPRPIVSEGAPPAGAPVAIVAPPHSEELRVVREELDRSRRRGAAMRRKLEELERRPATPPLEWIKALAPVLLPMLKPRGNATEEFVRALELGVKLGARGGGEDSPLGPIVDKALGVVQNIVAHNPNGAGTASSQQAAPVPAIAANGAGSELAAAKLVPLWLQRANPYLPLVAAWAKAGDDPAGRVGFVISALDEQTRDELGRACEAEDFVPKTLAALPAGFREPGLVTWMTRFLQLVQDAMAPAEEQS